MSCTRLSEREDFRLCQKAGTLDRDSQKVVKAAQDHEINLTRQAAKGAGRGETTKFTQSLTQFHIFKMQVALIQSLASRIKGLKIPRPSLGMRVRPPPPAPYVI